MKSAMPKRLLSAMVLSTAILALGACERVGGLAPFTHVTEAPESAGGAISVQKGDSAYSLSRRYNVPLDAYPTLLRAEESANKLEAFINAHPDRQQVPQ